MIPKLTVGGEIDHYLALPSGLMLLHVYAAGDCDRCSWPMVQINAGDYTVAKQRGILALALFDAREMDMLPADCISVELPDSTAFYIDDELWLYEQAEKARKATQ